jgi:hypothetical protein
MYAFILEDTHRENRKCLKTCGSENSRVREKEKPLNDFREAVYEGVNSIHTAKDRIVWRTFCKHDKNLQTGFLLHLCKISNPHGSKFSNTRARHTQISVISVMTKECVELFSRCNPFRVSHQKTSIKLYKKLLFSCCFSWMCNCR